MAAPFSDPTPTEVPLRDAPLTSVLVQVRFPEVLSIEQRDFVAKFQEAIRGHYPVLRQERGAELMIGAGGVTSRPGTLWRFQDISGDWRVTLAPTFVALQTQKYSSRANFLERLQVVVEALEAHIQPKVLDRLGIRYVDRLAGSALRDIAAFIRPELVGAISTDLGARVEHCISECLYRTDGLSLLGRWGLIPPGHVIDPSMMEPLHEPSWILDLDAFDESIRPFNRDDVVGRTRALSEKVYSFFRWAVTDEFLRHFGGNV